MEQADFEKYLSERYQDQIDWYSRKASWNKQCYVVFQWGVIGLSSVVPVLVIWLSEDWKWITAIVSIILAIGTAGLKTFKFQEIWVNYRTISETLKKERYFYQAGLDDYRDATDKEALFIERVESLISRENSLWVTTHMQQEEEEKAKMAGPSEPGKTSSTKRKSTSGQVDNF